MRVALPSSPSPSLAGTFRHCIGPSRAAGPPPPSRQGVKTTVWSCSGAAQGAPAHPPFQRIPPSRAGAAVRRSHSSMLWREDCRNVLHPTPHFLGGTGQLVPWFLVSSPLGPAVVPWDPPSLPGYAARPALCSWGVGSFRN